MGLNKYKRGLAATLIFAAGAGGAGLASNPAGAGPVLRVNIQGLEPTAGGQLDDPHAIFVRRLYERRS